MSVKITIPGADFSSSGLPKFEHTISGFPALNLKGLYLFEDGANGDAISVATDSSGLENHAPLSLGAAAGTKGAEGLIGTNYAAPPVFLASSVALGQAFTIILVGQANDVDSYPWFWRPQSDASTTVVNSQGGGEAIQMNQQVYSELSMRYYNAAGYLDNAASNSGQVERTFINSGRPSTDWAACAFSFNPAESRFRLAAFDQFVEVVSATPAAASAAKTGGHRFGVGRWGANTIAQTGKLGLFGLYAGEKTSGELATLISRAKMRMLLRGVTVY